MAGDTEKKSHRFNIFFKADMWRRLREHVKRKSEKAEATVHISDEVHRALDRYLGQTARHRDAE